MKSHIFFPSLSELVRYAEQLPNRSGYPDASGDMSLSEASRLVRFGWREGIAEATQVVERIAARVVEHDRSALANEPAIDYDVAGAAYDPASRIAGIPECWSRIVEPQVRRAVRIALNIEASGFISAKTIRQRGYAVSALAMVLQARGYPVTVDVVFEGGRNVIGCVRVVDADGSQLDLDRMVFGIAHPSMLRTFARCVMNQSRGGESGAWGSSMPKVDDRPEGEVDIWLSGCGSWEEEKWRDPEAWILAEYEKAAKST